ncbi:hypothetical protein sphantq_02489 [Sphingobium sp. AntQ-1]|nr:hypothetical protein sphantq_02489 [Sphingobium sp. AntQ-1]
MNSGVKQVVDRFCTGLRLTLASRVGTIPVREVNPIARMIVETREVFAVDGNIMQVLRGIPSRMGPHHDVVLVRCYQPPVWTPAPFVQAIQFHTLEDLVENGAVSFPMGLGQTARDFIRNWPPEAVAALTACVTPPSH